MTRYAADPPEARIAIALDGLVLLFHRPSGTTHILDSPAPELLAALAQGPADAAMLAGRLAAAYDLAAGEDAPAAAIAARCEELTAAGLAWRVADPQRA